MMVAHYVKIGQYFFYCRKGLSEWFWIFRTCLDADANSLCIREQYVGRFSNGVT
jgi:hypothetical protein